MKSENIVETYAQNCEDLILQILLPQKRGFYVDIGANSPKIDSVTKLFYEKGWKGINIEPIPSLHRSLNENRPRDVNLNVGISDKPGKLSLRIYQGDYHGWSTFSESIKGLSSRKEKSHRDLLVPVKTLREVLEEYNVKEIDFMKIDVEGFEYQVLISNNWKRWKPKVIVLENSTGSWHEFLKKQGYREIFYDGLNHYLVLPLINKELILRDLCGIFSKNLSGARLNFQNKLDNKDLEFGNLIEHPEDFISSAKLLKSLSVQVRRRFRKART